MVSVVFYFHAHQPRRITNFTFFDIGSGKTYFADELNRTILSRVVSKCYLPANELILHLIEEYGFKASYSITGVLIEQLREWFPEVLDSWRELVRTGNVDLVAEPYYHSLAFLFSEDELIEQTRLQERTLRRVFGKKPRAFRNMELVYSNRIGKLAEKMGYHVVLAEGHEKVLGWRSPTYVYKAKGADVRLLLRHYRLSDDIGFRFHDPNWEEYPLTAEKFAAWIDACNGNGYVVNLFMDYETLGEHKWSVTGIFEFFKHLPEKILANPDNDFATVSEAAKRYDPVDELDVPYYYSWADIERDLSAWIGDPLQRSALDFVMELEREVKQVVKLTGDKTLLDTWRKLTTSDNLYFMSLKYNADGDIHAYFRNESFETPYDAYISFMNIVHDLRQKLDEWKEKIREEHPDVYERVFLARSE